MDLIAQRKIFDILTRQAMFIEQVKINEAARFNDVLAEIDEDFRKQLGRVKYQTLDGLSKAQVQAFVRLLRTSQSRIYSKYQQALIKRLQDFMSATIRQTTIAVGSFYAHAFAHPGEDEDIPLLTFEQSQAVFKWASKQKEGESYYGLFMLLGSAAAMARLWPKVKNMPMPSGGALMLDYINTTIAGNMVRISNAVNNGWVNKLTVAEVLASVLGKAGEEKTSEVIKIRNTMRAVTATIMQHIGQQSVNGVTSAIWPQYVWVSVIDDRTSDICYSRHMNVYRVGQGPLPPAHPFCRSHTVPDVGGTSEWNAPTLYEWLKSQSSDFLKGLFGATIAAKFADGTVTRADFDKLKPLQQMTIAEFLSKTGDLL